MKTFYKTPKDKLEYQREYCRNNRERERVRTAKYYKKNRDAICSDRRAERAANPQPFRDAAREYKETHRERIAECKRASYLRCRDKARATQKAWVERNRARVRGYKKAWRERNPHYDIAIVNKRRAQKRSLPIEDCTEKIKVLSKSPFCHWCCTRLTKENRTIDHVTPLSRGGRHAPDNLVAACHMCNSTKNNKLVSEWTWKEAA